MFTFERSSSFRRLSTPWQSPTLYNIVHSGIGEQRFPGLCSLMFCKLQLLPTLCFFLLDGQLLILCQLCSHVHKIISEFFFQVEFNPAKTGRQRSHSSRFQNQTRHLTQTNFIQMMKGSGFPSTRTTNLVRLIFGSQYSIGNPTLSQVQLTRRFW